MAKKEHKKKRQKKLKQKENITYVVMRNGKLNHYECPSCGAEVPIIKGSDCPSCGKNAMCPTLERSEAEEPKKKNKRKSRR